MLPLIIQNLVEKTNHSVDAPADMENLQCVVTWVISTTVSYIYIPSLKLTAKALEIKVRKMKFLLGRGELLVSGRVKDAKYVNRLNSLNGFMSGHK